MKRRKLSILFSHNADTYSGCTYFRDTLPCMALQSRGHYARSLPVEVLAEEKNLIGLDVLVVGRVMGGPAEARMLREAIELVKARGIRLLVDYDDDLLNVPAHNPVRRKRTEAAYVALELADGVITTGPYLADVLRPHTSAPIALLPNYVDTSKMVSRPPRAADSPVVVGLSGSPSHVEDWKLIEAPLRRIKQKYGPRVKLLLSGYYPPYLTGLVDQFIEWAPMSRYYTLLSLIDIGLAPLPDTHFNRAKSPIKALDYGMAGCAMVASPTQYAPVLAGDRGLVADTEREWFDAISLYIDDVERRKADAQRLRVYTRSQDIFKQARTVERVYAELIK
jgi:hypothetical protein